MLPNWDLALNIPNFLAIGWVLAHPFYLKFKNEVLQLAILRNSRHWFSLIEGRKSYWAKVREIKKPI